MGKIGIGINLEFARHDDKSFEWSVNKAAELGYEYVEPMVHWGRELLNEAGYFHSVSMLDDPLRIQCACANAGVKLSGLSAHTPLCKPEIGIEPHQQYSRTPAGLDRIQGLVDSPVVGINFDTGNSYLSGEDPLIWLEHVLDRLVHLHAKDISVQQSDAERGKVIGTPVGCACGDGVVDWAGVIALCKRAPRDIVVSVECGTIEQGGRSIEHLRSLL